MLKFVTLLKVRVCAPDFAMKALEYRNDFDTFDREMFVVVHPCGPCSTFSDGRQLMTAQNSEINKKIIFSPLEGDKI